MVIGAKEGGESGGTMGDMSIHIILCIRYVYNPSNGKRLITNANFSSCINFSKFTCTEFLFVDRICASDRHFLM